MNFTEMFLSELDKVERDAKGVGLTLTSLCKSTDASRATPDRWRKRIPRTIALMTEFQDVVAARRKEVEDMPPVL